MKVIAGYLMFNGNCREAMEFYARAMGAKLDMMRAADMPNCPPEQRDMILHARLQHGSSLFMASDDLSGKQAVQGTNFSLSVDCESAEEQTRLFHALQEGGTVTMDLQDTFWGARFGMLKDRFGIGWMFNFDRELAA